MPDGSLTLKEPGFRRAIVGSRSVSAAAFSIMRTSASPRIHCRLRCVHERCRNIAGTLPGRRDAAGSSAPSSCASICPPANDEVVGNNFFCFANKTFCKVLWLQGETFSAKLRMLWLQWKHFCKAESAVAAVGNISAKLRMLWLQ